LLFANFEPSIGRGDGSLDLVRVAIWLGTRSGCRSSGFGSSDQVKDLLMNGLEEETQELFSVLLVTAL
jgi:hypothetical protein